MKKIFVFIVLLCSLCGNAQIKTQSNYDVNGDDKVNISDVTATVSAALGKATDERQVVDAESLNTLLKSIDARLANIEKKLGVSEDGEEESNKDTHEYVDLGLPSGTLWATCNVGATKPEEYGDYYAWGETEPYYTDGHSMDNPCTSWKTGKTGYNWANYKWGSGRDLTKYCEDSSHGTVDNKKVLDLADDAAYVNWGDEWRMPTHAEQQELDSGCTWSWTTLNGVYGRKGVSKYNSNTIFLPAAGYRDDSSLSDSSADGDYWSSSLQEGYTVGARILSFDSRIIDVRCNIIRCCGLPVRAVRR